MHTSTVPRWNPFRQYNLEGSVIEFSEQVNVSEPATTKPKVMESTVVRMPSWPEEARTLKHHDWITYLFMVGDVILVLLPIYFICKYSCIHVEHFLTYSSARGCSDHAQWETCRWQRLCFES